MTVKTIFVFLTACLLLVIMVAYGIRQTRSERSLTLLRHRFVIELADTEMKRNKGLMGRVNLASDHGMLFVFGVPALSPFWMKGMKFPIDIIWIASDRVIGAVENAMPDDGKALYYPPHAVDYALEVPAGTVARLDIRIGTSVNLK